MGFVIKWSERNPNHSGWEWPKSTLLLELIYSLTHYFPTIYNDPEGQVYLEVFTRQISTCEQLGSFSGQIIYEPSNRKKSEASIRELLWNFFAPIASGVVKINEDLLKIFPRNRLCIFSIHQAKGLEFPLTIVDVGSDFHINHAAQAIKRFPRDGGTPHRFETLLRPYSNLSKHKRSEKDRAFDDLYRQFFVAYSRPQNILLLVGSQRILPGGPVPNVATGYKRNRDCPWNQKRPFMEI